MTRSLAALALALGLAPSAFASEMFSDRASAEACARAFQEQSGEHVYEVVKLVSHTGLGAYSIWMNSESESFAGFCRTDRGEVTTTFARDSHWVEFYRPSLRELAAR